MQYSYKLGGDPVLQVQQFQCDFQHLLQLFLGYCPQLEPAKAHKTMNPQKLEITKYRGLQWELDLDHTPPIKKEEQGKMQKSCHRSMSCLLDHT